MVCASTDLPGTSPAGLHSGLSDRVHPLEHEDRLRKAWEGDGPVTFHLREGKTQINYWFDIGLPPHAGIPVNP